MSHIFDDREKQFEAKYKHDEELHFKVMVRRDKLLGLWAAKQMGLAGAEADAYAKALIELSLEKRNDEHVIEHLVADFKARKLEISPHRVRGHLDECLEEAQRQVMYEVKT